MRNVVRAPGVSFSSSATSSSTLAGKPFNVATRWRSDSAKSISPRIAASVMAATESRTPTRSASISMTSCWISVESTSNTISRLARRSSVVFSSATSTFSFVATPDSAVGNSSACSTGTDTRSSRPVTG